jgi:type II secretory pathway component PulF
MPSFQFKAVTSTGQIISNTLDATSEAAASKELVQKGYRPISLKAVGGKNAAVPGASAGSGSGMSKEIKLFAPKVKQDEIIMFTRQLVTLLRAGVPMLTALEALRDQSGKAFAPAVNKIYVDVMSGKSFSQALDQHPNVFSKLYVNSVKAGEMSGSLDLVLERMGALIKHDAEIKKKVKAALQYPSFVMAAMILAFIVVMTMVVPNFAKMFEGLNMELPLPTKIMLGISTFMKKNVLFVVGFAVTAAVAFRTYIRTAKGRFWWDGLLLKIPLIGNVVLKSAMSRFTRMFETLNRSGLPILQTLTTVAGAVGNTVIEKQIQQVALGVEKGEGISGSMKKSTLFPPMVNRMIAIGEQSGSLDNMLDNIAGHYDLEVEHAVKSLTGMIEPVLTVVMGGAVIILMLGIFLPMWNMIGMVK